MAAIIADKPGNYSRQGSGVVAPGYVAQAVPASNPLLARITSPTLQPVAQPAATSSQSFYSAPSGGGGTGGGGGGGTDFGGGGGAPAPAPTPAIPTDQDFLNSDDVYLAALANYKRVYDDLIANAQTREDNYNLDYNNSVAKLGYTAPTEEGGLGSWNWNDQTTTSGRAYQNLIQDFAARGLLNSGDYTNAQGNLQTQLLDQYTNMNDAKQTFAEGLASERQAGKTAQTNGNASAMAEALARKAAMYGTV